MFGLHAAVETVLSPEIQIREAVGAAIATFQAFEIWIGAVS